MKPSTSQIAEPLTPAEQREHLMLFFFGPGEDAVLLSIRRAYRDVNRTLHGIKAYKDGSAAAREYLCHQLRGLPQDKSVENQIEFDAWHRLTCTGLIESFKGERRPKMHFGQAQKWLNMSLKYIFFFDPVKVEGYARFFRLCHVPIDNIILKSEAFKNAPKFECAWSRIDDYSKYMAFQHWARTAFDDNGPLAAEFAIWAREQHAA